MPVDRAKRDAVADALASFLRSEIHRGELGDVLQYSVQSDEREGQPKSEKDPYLDDLVTLWFIEERYGPISEKMWKGLCRHLAFLKSDLELRRWPGHSHEDDDTPRQIVLARWHTLGLLVAFGVAYLTSWWVFAASTLISFLLYQVAMWKHDRLADEEMRRLLKQRMEFYPFADRDEWLTHKHLLDQYHIPAYDPATFYEPSQVSKWPSFLAFPARFACFVFVAAIFAYMYIFSVVMWPLWLVLRSLCRD